MLFYVTIDYLKWFRHNHYTIKFRQFPKVWANSFRSYFPQVINVQYDEINWFSEKHAVSSMAHNRLFPVIKKVPAENSVRVDAVYVKNYIKQQETCLSISPRTINPYYQ